MCVQEMYSKIRNEIYNTQANIIIIYNGYDICSLITIINIHKLCINFLFCFMYRFLQTRMPNQIFI